MKCLRNKTNGNIVAWSENLAKRTDMEIYDPDAADKRAAKIMESLGDLKVLDKAGKINADKVESARTVVALIVELEALLSQLTHKVGLDARVNRQKGIEHERMTRES